MSKSEYYVSKNAKEIRKMLRNKERIVSAKAIAKT